MKIFKSILMFSLLLYFPLKADSEVSDIQNLVEQIKNAPDDKKRTLMNQLKIKLKRMSSEIRKETIKELKKSFKSHKRVDTKSNRKREWRGHHKNHRPKFRHLQRGLQNQHNTNRQRSGHK